MESHAVKSVDINLGCMEIKAMDLKVEDCLVMKVVNKDDENTTLELKQYIPVKSYSPEDIQAYLTYKENIIKRIQKSKSGKHGSAKLIVECVSGREYIFSTNENVQIMICS